MFLYLFLLHSLSLALSTPLFSGLNCVSFCCPPDRLALPTCMKTRRPSVSRMLHTLGDQHADVWAGEEEMEELPESVAPSDEIKNVAFSIRI